MPTIWPKLFSKLLIYKTNASPKVVGTEFLVVHSLFTAPGDNMDISDINTRPSYMITERLFWNIAGFPREIYIPFSFFTLSCSRYTYFKPSCEYNQGTLILNLLKLYLAIDDMKNNFIFRTIVEGVIAHIQTKIMYEILPNWCGL